MSNVKFMNIQVFEIDRIDHVTLGHMTFSFMTKTDKKRHFTYHIKSQVHFVKMMFDLNAVSLKIKTTLKSGSKKNGEFESFFGKNFKNGT